MDIWGFNVTKQPEIILWCFVVKYSPFIPPLFDKHLKQYIAQFIVYEIRLNMGESTFSYAHELLSALNELLWEQRQIIAAWMKSMYIAKKVPRRMGKSTIIAELINIIPESMSVLLIIPSLRYVSAEEDDSNVDHKNLTIISHTHLLSIDFRLFDFIFAEHLDAQLFTFPNNRVLILN